MNDIINAIVFVLVSEQSLIKDYCTGLRNKIELSYRS